MYGNRMLTRELKKSPRLYGVWAVMPHHTGEIAKPRDLIKEMQSVQESLIGDFQMLAQVVLAEADVDARRLIAKAYPYPRKPARVELAEKVEDTTEMTPALRRLMETAVNAERRWENSKDRIDERRAAALTLFEKFNEENPNLANTAWGVYNAVVETEDWREPYGREDADYSLLFGLRANTKERAFAEVMEYAEL